VYEFIFQALCQTRGSRFVWPAEVVIVSYDLPSWQRITGWWEQLSLLHIFICLVT